MQQKSSEFPFSLLLSLKVDAKQLNAMPPDSRAYNECCFNKKGKDKTI
jgi:hypothetical protein